MTTLRKFFLGIAILTVPFVAIGNGEAAVVVTTGRVEGAPGTDVEVPITLKGVKDVKGLSCMTLRLNYDTALLTFKSLDKGPALPNALFDKSIDEKADPGKLALGFVCGSKTVGGKEMASVDDDGVVLKIVFTVNDKAEVGKKSPLKVDNIRAGDTDELQPNMVAVNPQDGEFIVIRGSLMGGIPQLWIYIAIGIGIGVLLLLIIVILLTRRREPTQQPAVSAPSSPIVPPRFTPQPATFNHKCTQCGGVIQMPVAMVGQSFQCGACGTTQVAKPT